MQHPALPTRPRRFPFALALAGFTAALVASGHAADAKTTVMSPFKVEAEFGIDGVRIQNSQSVLNAYLLEQHGIASLQELTGAAPNLATSNSDTRGFGDVLSLRGLTNSIFFTSPAVALSVDDVPGASVSAYPSALLAVESFTVKAGPQSTDTGRNAPGGLIEIRTRTPGPRHQGKILLDYGNYNYGSVQAAFDGPVSDKVGYSVAFGISEQDGFIDNTTLNRTADDRSNVAGRGALFFRPDAKTQIRVGLMFENVRDDANRLSSLFSPDRFKVGSDLNGETAIERRQYSLQAKRVFDFGTVIATTSKQTFDVEPATTDLDLSALPLAFSNVLQADDTWTQEVRFESVPTADKGQWRAGLFYYDNGSDSSALRQFVVPPSAFVPPNFVQTERTVADIDQTNLAGYANLDYPLGAATMLKVGGRIEKTESAIDRTKVATNNFGFPSPQDARLRADQSSVYFATTAALQHTLSRALTLQARSSIAHKPEGYSAFTGNPALTRFDDERQWANEIGLVYGPPQSRFGGSVLAFWSQIDGYQFERTVPNSTDYVVVNAAEVITRGFEAKFMWSPVERVWWDFQAGYTDATFENHRDATGARVDGNRVPFVPRYTLRTGVTVDFGGGFSGNVSYAAFGRTYYNERNTATFAQKSYGTVNAQLRYRIGQWTLAVYARNVFEKDYYQFVNPEIFAGAPGAPRRFGVQAAWEF